MRLLLYVSLVCRALAAFGEEPSVDREALAGTPPVEPDRALATFQVKPGFRVELAAAEPLVVDPVAMCFDEDGRMYVIEMRDYSERRDERLGRVRLLEDRDSDGWFETSSVFAENLAWPTAVIAYGGGVFVAATPDLLFLKDTDRDGKADERRVVFTGFGQGVERLNVQALPNSFNWSLDTRIHGATGPNGGSVVRAGSNGPTTNAAVELRGRDFSFDPRTLDFRAETGGSQHGLSFDNRGRKFVCSNSSHIQALMYEERYAARNRVYSLPRALVDIAADGGAAPVYRISPDEPWRVIRTQWRVAGKVPGPIEGGGRPSGYFTSATGVTIYRGDAYGPDFVGDAFVGDCGSNLVHRKKVRSSGKSVEPIAERPADEQKSEFLASSDNWFRPVQFANAPDGCLYILDMYREVIEHPWSLPPGIKKHLDLNRGNDRGRIYRVVPEKFRRRGPVRLSRASTAELVRTLEHPNGWHRDTAARLLYERQDKSAARRLRELARNSKHEMGRLHPLYALAGLGELTADDLGRALKDRSGVVRQHAVRLSEGFPALGTDVARLVDDPDPLVRYQLAFTLGTSDGKAAPLGVLLRRDANDRWIRAAALSSLDTPWDDGAEAASVFAAIADAPGAPLGELARLIGAQGNTSAVNVVVERVAKSRDPLALAGALAEGLKQAQRRIAEVVPRDLLERLSARAARISADTEQSVAVRKRAIEFLGSTEAIEPLVALLRSPAAPELQVAAVRSLAAVRGRDLPAAVLPLWPKLAPQARSEAIAALIQRPEGAAALLDALGEGRVDKAAFSAQHVQALANHADAKLAERARVEFGVASDPDREKLIRHFIGATRMTGDAEAGRRIYRERCAACHRAGNEGFAVGPDVAAMKTSGKEKLLVNIVDPNREVAPNFQSYLLETVDGETVSGLLVREMPGSVTLTGGGGSETTLIRAQIRKLSPSGKSLMPEGLEQGLSVEQFADLLEFLSAP